MTNRASRWATALLVCLLLGSGILVYAQARHFQFVSWDDADFILNNPHLRQGLGWPALTWIFTADLVRPSPHVDYFQPVTSLSHLLVITCFGLDAGAHHLVNVAFHLAAGLVLFAALRRATGQVLPSAFAAAVFLLHPAQVESVAWVTERKDVLAGFFTWLSLYAYVVHAETGCPRWRDGSLLCFALAALSKPTAVTFPVLLLFLDYWPLGRIPWPPARALLVERIKEKGPYFLVSLGCVATTLLAQNKALGLVSPLEMAGGIPSLILDYVGRFILPVGLAPYYTPRHYPLPPVEILISSALVLVLLAGVFFLGRRRPAIAVGSLVFLGALAPVLTLTDIRGADRFTYLPMAGAGIVLGWILFGETRRLMGLRLVLGLAILASYVLISREQAGTWRNDRTLFTHAVSVTPDNPRMLNNLASALEAAGDTAGARVYFTKAYQRDPGNPGFQINMGILARQEGRETEARALLVSAVRAAPRYPEGWFALGEIEAAAGRETEARQLWMEALRREPGFALAHRALADQYRRAGRTNEAAYHQTRLEEIQAFIGE